MINIKMLRARLNDLKGAMFTDQELEGFIEIGQMIAQGIYKKPSDHIVFHAAVANALMVRALKVAETPNTIVDGGIMYTSNMAEFLMTQAEMEYDLVFAAEHKEEFSPESSNYEDLETYDECRTCID